MALKDLLRADRNLSGTLAQLAEDVDALRRELADDVACPDYHARELVERIAEASRNVGSALPTSRVPMSFPFSPQ